MSKQNAKQRNSSQNLIQKFGSGTEVAYSKHVFALLKKREAQVSGKREKTLQLARGAFFKS